MPIDYSTGKIYCIRNLKSDDRIVYIGSTVQRLSERMAEHRKTMLIKPTIKIYIMMAEVGAEHFHIELICNFPCTNREELLAEEGRHIRLHDTYKNGGNSVIAGRNQKMYYTENQERLLEEKKQYYKKNVEVLREKDKVYYAANKAKVADANREYRIKNAAKLKAYDDDRKEEKKAQNKAYHAAHRDSINARKKAQRARVAEPAIPI